MTVGGSLETVDVRRPTGRKAGGTYTRSTDEPAPTVTSTADRWRIRDTTE